MASLDMIGAPSLTKFIATAMSGTHGLQQAYFYMSQEIFFLSVANRACCKLAGRDKGSCENERLWIPIEDQKEKSMVKALLTKEAKISTKALCGGRSSVG